MSNYYPAEICLNGHVVSDNEKNIETYCSICGAKTISSCPSCNSPIRGQYNSEFVLLDETYVLPKYCYACGKAYPWTQSSIEAIQELVELDEQLSEEEKNYIDNNISALTTEVPKTKVVATKVKLFLKKAGTTTATAIKDILVDVASETAKRTIFGQ